MRTQWRVVSGLNGESRKGIDYTALYGHPKFARLCFDEQDTRLAQIQHIEAGALAIMNSQSNLADEEAEESRQTQATIMARQAEQVSALLRAKQMDSKGRFVA